MISPCTLFQTHYTHIEIKNERKKKRVHSDDGEKDIDEWNRIEPREREIHINIPNRFLTKVQKYKSGQRTRLFNK